MVSTKHFALVFAVLVPLTGCGSAVDTATPVNANKAVETVEPTPTESSDPTSTPTESPTPAPTEAASTPEESQEDPQQNRTQLLSTESEDCSEINGTVFCGPAEQRSEEIRLAATHAFENLPENRSERLAVTAQMANASCANATETANLSVVDPVENASSLSKRQLYRVKHGAETLQGFNDRVDPKKVEAAIDTADTVATYATVVGTFQNYNEAACAFDRDDPESVEDYYLATATLTVELAMLQYGVAYRVSSKATRMASHTRTFGMIQSHFGDDALRIAMSETHWLVRGQMDGSQAMIASNTDEHNLSISNTSVNETRMLLWVNSTTGLNATGQEILNESQNATSDLKNETASVAENATSNETVSDVKNSTEELEEEFKKARNDSGAFDKASWVREVDVGDTEGLLSGGVSAEEAIEILGDSLEPFTECLSKD